MVLQPLDEMQQHRLELYVISLQKYFSCDSDWMAYAARSTGFEESEVKATRIPHDKIPLAIGHTP